MSETATAIKEAQDKHRLGHVVARLLDNLLQFVRAYPMTVDGEMPEHDLVWVEGIEKDGPGQTILDAIKANHELWRGALPPEVCIVPRKALEQLGLSADIIDHLVDMGDYSVVGHAAWHYRDFEERKRYSRDRS